MTQATQRGQLSGPFLGRCCCLFLATLLAVGGASAADYAETVRATRGLLAYYRFEESGDAAIDSSGLGHEGRFEGEVLRGVDSAYAGLGRAIRLTGSGYLRVPDLGNADAVTVELWLNQTVPAAEGIAALYAADGWQPNFVHFNVRKTGALELAVNGTSSFANTEAEVVVSGRWLHVAASYDRTTGMQRIFRDGRVVHESVAVPQVPVKLIRAAIGAWIRGMTSRPLVADLDEVAIYSVALPPGQLRSHYLAGQGKELVSADFVRDIRPILEKRCFGCHGPKQQESQLRLDVRDWVLRGGESGEPAIMPFDSDVSQLIQRVSSKVAETVMPPEGCRWRVPRSPPCAVGSIKERFGRTSWQVASSRQR